MKLLFVYNADSGLFNTLSDIAHKLFSPDTYQCQLCAITHSAFRERKAWKRYIETLGIPCEFLHRDEFTMRHQTPDAKFPAVFQETDGRLTQCVTAEELAACRSMEELAALVAASCGGSTTMTTVRNNREKNDGG